MDINNALLILFVISVCVALLLRFSRGWSALQGWGCVVAGILVALSVLLLVDMRRAGLIGTGMLLVLVVFPMSAMAAVSRRVLRQDYAAAARLTACWRWLHPFDGWWQQPALYRALALGQRGEFAEAERILARFSAQDTPIGHQATLQLFRMHNHWEECLAWIRQHYPSPELEKHANILLLYLRALGETGELNTLVDTFARVKPVLQRFEASISSQGYLSLFAFLGDDSGVARLCAGPLAPLPPDWQRFWRATAAMAAGDDAGAEMLRGLREAPDAVLRQAVARRLAVPPADPARILTQDRCYDH